MITELRLLILGLLAREPRSAYAMGRALSEMPASGFSGSPGAIYPAVRVMERDGLLERKGDPSEATRGRPYLVTEAGHRLLSNWLEGPIDGWDLVRSPGTVLLRLSFLKESSARNRFRRELSKSAREALTSLRAYHAAAERDLADGSDEAIQLTEALLGAYVSWAGEQDETWAGEHDETPD